MRVVVWWELLSGYMAACWRALAEQPGVELFVIAKQTELATANAAFSPSLLDGIPSALLPPEEAMDADRVAACLGGQPPDVLLIAGWRNPAYLKVLARPELARTKVVLATDTPSHLRLHRYLTSRARRRALFARADHFFVPGERARQHALMLGFPAARITTGLYGCDVDAFAGAAAARPDAWPRQFLFVGRLVPEKGLATLDEGYQAYRDQSADPWGLTVCGHGPLAADIRDAPGVDHRGFVPPDQLPQLFAEHGAFVLPSWYEPWGIVLAEAGAARMPIVATTESGGTAELVREFYNGRTVPARDAAALTDALLWIESRYGQLPELGARSAELVQPYGARTVAERWARLFAQVAGQPTLSSRDSTSTGSGSTRQGRY